MRIAIDCRELCGQAGGFRTYLVGLLAGLAEMDSVNEYVLYVRSCSDLHQVSFPTRATPAPVSGGRLWSDWFALKKRIRVDNPHVVHFPCNYGLKGLATPSVVTLHDCICLKRAVAGSSPRTRLLVRYNAFMIRRSIPSASAVITVSSYSREQLIQMIGPLRCARVIHQGVIDCETDARSRQATSLPAVGGGPYFLLLASVDPRKNVTTALDAFSGTQAASEDCRIAVVCSHADAARFVERRTGQIGLGSRAIVLTRMSDPELRALYRNAVALLFPSLDEGFGLPPLEAMAQGCPVISSNAASMPEVLSEAAVYFDPLDCNALAAAIDQVWGSAALREDLRARGLERASQFSWRKTAEETLQVYADAAKSRERR